MPIEVSYPGVYLQEIPNKVLTVPGVSTASTAFADFFPRGPMNKASRIESFRDFERTFGGLDQRSEASYAIQQYFTNGGKQGWVIRTGDGTATKGVYGVDIQIPSLAERQVRATLDYNRAKKASDLATAAAGEAKETWLGLPASANKKKDQTDLEGYVSETADQTLAAATATRAAALQAAVSSQQLAIEIAKLESVGGLTELAVIAAQSSADAAVRTAHGAQQTADVIGSARMALDTAEATTTNSQNLQISRSIIRDLQAVVDARDSAAASQADVAGFHSQAESQSDAGQLSILAIQASLAAQSAVGQAENAAASLVDAVGTAQVKLELPESNPLVDGSKAIQNYVSSAGGLTTKSTEVATMAQTATKAPEAKAAIQEALDLASKALLVLDLNAKDSNGKAITSSLDLGAAPAPTDPTGGSEGISAVQIGGQVLTGVSGSDGNLGTGLKPVAAQEVQRAASFASLSTSGSIVEDAAELASAGAAAITAIGEELAAMTAPEDSAPEADKKQFLQDVKNLARRSITLASGAVGDVQSAVPDLSSDVGADTPDIAEALGIIGTHLAFLGAQPDELTKQLNTAVTDNATAKSAIVDKAAQVANGALFTANPAADGAADLTTGFAEGAEAETVVPDANDNNMTAVAKTIDDQQKELVGDHQTVGGVLNDAIKNTVEASEDAEKSAANAHAGTQAAIEAAKVVDPALSRNVENDEGLLAAAVQQATDDAQVTMGRLREAGTASDDAAARANEASVQIAGIDAKVKDADGNDTDEPVHSFAAQVKTSLDGVQTGIDTSGTAVDAADSVSKAADMTAKLTQYAADGAKVAADAADVTVKANQEASKDPKLLIYAANEGVWGNNIRVAVELVDPNSTRFNLRVEEMSFSGNVQAQVAQEFFPNLSLDRADGRNVWEVIKSQSKLVSAGSQGAILEGAYPAEVENRYLGGGTDGGHANAMQLTDALIVLDDIKPEIFNILCLPATGTMNDAQAGFAITAAHKFCGDRRAFMIVDPPPHIDTVDGIINWTKSVRSADSIHMATYWPRLIVPDPINDFRPRNIGASGTMAGMYARTDAAVGVWKAPAGVDGVLRGAELAVPMTDSDNGRINVLGINGLRGFPVYGNIAWGARTLAGADLLMSEYKYLNVRRLMNYVEESIFQSLKWAVFETNGPALWGKIVFQVSSFLAKLFTAGAFQGASPADAYFVTCDGTTTTQVDIDMGIVNVEIGIAPVKPAEFIVLKFQQITNQGG